MASKKAHENGSGFLYLVILNTEFCKGFDASVCQIVRYHLTKLFDVCIGGRVILGHCVRPNGPHAEMPD